MTSQQRNRSFAMMGPRNNTNYDVLETDTPHLYGSVL